MNLRVNVYVANVLILALVLLNEKILLRSFTAVCVHGIRSDIIVFHRYSDLLSREYATQEIIIY